MVVTDMSDKRGKRYRPKPYRITFDAEHELADLEVHARRMSVGDLLELMSVAEMAQDVADGTARDITEAHKQAVSSMIARLAAAIIWWNVDNDDGDPVTPDEAGVRSQDFVMVMAIFNAYYERVTSVMPPLPPGSPAGPSPAELASIPTETLPASQPS